MSHMLAATRSLQSAIPAVGNAPPRTPARRRPAGVMNLSRQIARFAPTDIAADVSALPANERRSLSHMIRAAQVMDALFLEQVWAGNEAMLVELLRDESPAGETRLHAFLINKGPWSRLDHNEPFIPGAPPKPAAGNYYPVGATKEEVEQWMASAAASREDRGDRVLHDHSARTGRPVRRRAVQHRVSGRARARGRAPARGRGAATTQPTLESVSRSRAPRRSSRTTTTRATSSGWSSTPASSRRSGRTRSTRTSGSTTRPRSRRSSPSRTPAESQKLQKFAGSLQEIENNLPIDPEVPQPEARRARPDRGGQHRLLGRRREPRRPDRRIQPAE